MPDRDELATTARGLVEELSARAATAYRPAKERSGVALCLSGGGFRAALFDLGALQRLKRTGNSLERRDDLVGFRRQYSGGALGGDAEIMAGARRRGRRTGRTGRAALRGFRRPKPEDGRDTRASAPLELAARQHGSGGAEGSLRARAHTAEAGTELPDRPRFVLSATDMAFGINWIFERRGPAEGPWE